ncbi:hypothetical protein [Spiroplasma endosymbiont of Nebria brevicollis]|uniref:hypothetical protein n=1 Tax=Spiroplasma endosymbiont of Nebria brevicollis TaxID=3066284 RepID=UPI00313ECF12
MIVLTQGHMPTADNEVVISNLKSNANYSLNSIVTINGKDYTISNYIWNSIYNTDFTVFLNNSNMNKLWLPQTSNNTNSRYSYFFVNMDSSQYTTFMTSLNTNFTRPLNVINFQDLFKNNISFQLANAETLIFSIFGFVIFIISAVIITIFLKKGIKFAKIFIRYFNEFRSQKSNLSHYYGSFLCYHFIFTYCFRFWCFVWFTILFNYYY